MTRILIIPPHKLARAAALNENVLIMGKAHLDQLTKNVRNFFSGFRKVDLKNLSETKIADHLQRHDLTVEKLKIGYGRKPVAHKR